MEKGLAIIKKAVRRLTPKFFQEIFTEPFRYVNMSYSQEGEDTLLARFFENKKGFGFYIDVGAHHPQRFSNTYCFYKKGWSGINIDAMPGCMKAFDRDRERDLNLEAAVSDKEEILTYYIFNEPALNGFHKELSRGRDKNGGYFITGTREIKTVKLSDILDRHSHRFKEIDFLSVDVEGLDLQVLKSNNWDKYRPAIVMTEDLDNFTIDEKGKSQVVGFLEKTGYRLYAKTVNTLFFIDAQRQR